jgi:hypothetical protein
VAPLVRIVGDPVRTIFWLNVRFASSDRNQVRLRSKLRSNISIGPLTIFWVASRQRTFSALTKVFLACKLDLSNQYRGL